MEVVVKDKYQLIKYKDTSYSPKLHKATEKIRYGILYKNQIITYNHTSQQCATMWIINKIIDKIYDNLEITKKAIEFDFKKLKNKQ